MNNEVWSLVSLGDVCDIIPGFAFRSSDWKKSGIPVIKIQNILSNLSVDVENTDFVPVQIMSPKLEKYKVGKGDILVAMTGATVGKVGRVSKDTYALLNQRVAKIVPTEIDSLYAWAVISSAKIQHKFFDMANGAAQANLSGGQISSVSIPLPPLSIQRRIGEILGRLDDKIEVNRRLNATLEAIAQALYQHWFVEFGPFQEGNFVESELGLIPERWGVGRLGDLIETNSETVRKGEEPNTILYVDISSVTQGKINEFASMLYTKAPSRARRKVKHGDIIWTGVRPNRKIYALIQYPPENLVISTGFVVLRATHAPYTYIYQVVTTDEFVDFLVTRESGAAYPAVNADDFMAYPMIQPPNDVLKQYHYIVEPFLNLSANLKEEEKALALLRDYLLPKLLSGEVTVEAGEEIAKI